MEQRGVGPRVFEEAVHRGAGALLLNGKPLDGILLKRDLDGRFQVVRVVDGKEQGEYVEPFFGPEPSAVVTGEEDSDVLVEELEGQYFFEGQRFTGIGVEAHVDVPGHVGRYTEYEDGWTTGRSIEWHPDGGVAALNQEDRKLSGGRSLKERYAWWPDGTLRLSIIRMAAEAPAPNIRATVRLDESGRLSEVVRRGLSGAVANNSHLNDVFVGPVVLTIADLASYRLAPEVSLVLDEGEQEDIVEQWSVAGAFAEVERLICSLSSGSLGGVLAAAPRLNHVEYRSSDGPGDEPTTLLRDWERSVSGRSVLIR